MRPVIVTLLSLSLLGAAHAKGNDPTQEIAKILQDICDAAKKKELDRLDAFHAYGPKFSKFDDDGLGRQDAVVGKKSERDGIGGVKAFVASFDDLKVDVFGTVAVATFILKYDVDTGKEKMAGKDRSTMVFSREGGAWKIVHEHHSPLSATK
jgi:hypothetical protein